VATVTINYGTPVTVTMTGIEDIDASSGLTAGWTTGSVNNTSDKHVDFLLSGQFTCESTNQQAGTIAVYVYGSYNTTPTWPDLFSSGTEGTVGAATCHDSEERDSGMRLAAAITGDGTASAVYTFSPVSVASLFGGVVPPYWAAWVTGNTASSTNDLFVASGTALYIQPVKYDVA
jgi:hypothetical protein